MKYAREYKEIAKRMAEAVELEEAWKDVEEVYGKKAAQQLKKTNTCRSTAIARLNGHFSSE